MAPRHTEGCLGVSADAGLLVFLAAFVFAAGLFYFKERNIFIPFAPRGRSLANERRGSLPWLRDFVGAAAVVAAASSPRSPLTVPLTGVYREIRPLSIPSLSQLLPPVVSPPPLSAWLLQLLLGCVVIYISCCSEVLVLLPFVVVTWHSLLRLVRKIDEQQEIAKGFLVCC